MNKVRHLGKHDYSSLLASLGAILVGLLLGVILLGATSSVPGTDFGKGLGLLFTGPFELGIRNIGNRIFYAVPLIFTGLSVAVAYKTGLFNIGAPGQFLLGTGTSLLIALTVDSTGKPLQAVAVWILAVLAGRIAGALWGVIPGLLKAVFGINEVIICIRTNWIAANRFTWVFDSLNPLHATGTGKAGYLIKTSVTGNYTPTIGLDKLTNGSRLDLSILIAIVVALLLWILRNKTTLGYSRRACGRNKFSARYAGRKEKGNIIFSMALAGGLAALGGAFYYLNPGIEIQYKSVYGSLPTYGFDGIPAALLANCNPLAVILSSLFMRYIYASGSTLSAAGYNKYYADRIIAVIIYRSGFSRFFVEAYNRIKQKHAYERGKKYLALLTEGLLLTTLPALDEERPVDVSSSGIGLADPEKGKTENEEAK